MTRRSELRIGLLYARGEGVIRSIPDAAEWFKCAAERGSGEAQLQLGKIFANGAGPGAADRWFQSASQCNNEIANRNLKALFPRGITIKKDPEAAIHWMLAAARSGKVEAQSIVGDMYPGIRDSSGLQLCP